MKILYLNCWHGKLQNEIIDYIKKESLTVDVFCLQEVNPELQDKLSSILFGYVSFYKSIPVKNRFTEYYGQSVFIKNYLKVVKEETIDIYINRKPNYGFLQIVEISEKGVNFIILNLHGRSQPGHKLDTKTRIVQSKRILESLANKKGIKIIGGDFNLEQQTRSVKIIEQSGFLNLIKEFKISTTRNKLAWNESKINGKNGIIKYYKKQYFADYCFVSPEIRIKNFEVPDIEVSDHLPLILDFEVDAL